MPQRTAVAATETEFGRLTLVGDRELALVERTDRPGAALRLILVVSYHLHRGPAGQRLHRVVETEHRALTIDDERATGALGVSPAQRARRPRQ